MIKTKRNILYFTLFSIVFFLAGMGQGQAAQVLQSSSLTEPGAQIANQIKPKKKKAVKSAKKKIKKVKTKKAQKIKKVKTDKKKVAQKVKSKKVKKAVKKAKAVKKNRVNKKIRNKISQKKSKTKAKLAGSKRKTANKAYRQCAAITQDGSRCKRNAAPGSKYCWQHKNYRKK